MSKVNHEILWWGSQPVNWVIARSLFCLYYFHIVIASFSLVFITQLHFGTKKLTEVLESLANCMASSLFMVDRPPLEDVHALAKSLMHIGLVVITIF